MPPLSFDATKVPPSRRYRARELGYVRRPDWDQPGIWAWEAPDGSVYGHDAQDEPMLDKSEDLDR